MKRALGVGLVAVFGATIAIGETVAPTEVAYVDGAVESSLSGQAGDPENGAILMNKGAGNCIACHEVSALNHLAFHGEVGPTLDGVADRWSEAELRGIVANAKQTFEGTIMPAFYKTDGFVRLGDAYSGKAHGENDVMPLLTAQEIEDVVSYLVTLKEQ